MAEKTIKEVVKAGGGPTVIGAALKISRSAVSQWTRVPIERVAEVERLTGIPRQELRPDIFDRTAA